MGTAFVVVLDGKRHLAGMFWPSYPSFCCCPLPLIGVTLKAVTVPIDECPEIGVRDVPLEALVGDYQQCVTEHDVPQAIDQFAINGLSDGGALRKVFKRLG